MKVSLNKNNPTDKNRAEERRHQLQYYLGNSANILHRKINLDEFRNYILSLFFYKYLSAKIERFVDSILKQDRFKFAELKEHYKGGVKIMLGYCLRILI
ncbi:type I restriction-modification system subunit M N-terminal domain-containing protein [Nitrosomonas ureae]|uniref:HsdM N-terminal domain-containing protein n=1 Tax=Nitrosomonas ureae TaxID=44577 RepID=A0A1H5UTF0_9PROT|nr:HsdM N-terminal domain-containing protein [Nitrosomonas ureae]